MLVPLLGVAIGAAGALLGQHLANRVTTRQARAVRMAAERDERKQQILAFLEAAQSVEQAAEYLFFNGRRLDDTVARTHSIWFHQKCMELVCTAALNDKTIDYARRMHDACYKDLPERVAVWDYIAEMRNPFLAAAREELGIAAALPAERVLPRRPDTR